MSKTIIRVQGKSALAEPLGYDEQGREWRFRLSGLSICCRNCGGLRDAGFGERWILSGEPQTVLCPKCVSLKNRWKGFGTCFRISVTPPRKRQHEFAAAWRGEPSLGTVTGCLWVPRYVPVEELLALRRIQAKGLIAHLSLMADPQIYFCSRDGGEAVFELLAGLTRRESFRTLVEDLFEEVTEAD